MRIVTLAAGLFLASESVAYAQSFADALDIPSPGNAVELAFAPAHAKLVLKNTASAITVVDLCSGTTSVHPANTRFTDMSLSPDGDFLFAADYGGENIGYGTPSGQSYVHRLDLAAGTWEAKTAVIAGDIQATTATTFVLKSIDQWVTFTNNAWGTGTAVTQLSTNNGSFPGYYATVYEGNFRYDFRTARLIHGNSGDSSQEIQAFKIVGNEFVKQEGSGIYGSASGYGPNVALATDGSVFYYGALGVDALDVTHNLHVYPETIWAATGQIAFGSASYYDATTGSQIASLGFTTSVYALNPGGADFWAYDASANMLRYFVPVADAGPAGNLGDGGLCALLEDGGTVSDAGPTSDGSSSPDSGPVSDAEAPSDATSPVDAEVSPGSNVPSDAEVVVADATADAGAHASIVADAAMGADASRMNPTKSFDGGAARAEAVGSRGTTTTSKSGCGMSGGADPSSWASLLPGLLLLAARRRKGRS